VAIGTGATGTCSASAITAGAVFFDGFDVATLLDVRALFGADGIGPVCFGFLVTASAGFAADFTADFFATFFADVSAGFLAGFSADFLAGLLGAARVGALTGFLPARLVDFFVDDRTLGLAAFALAFFAAMRDPFAGDVAVDFLRVILDIRLPFVAFDGSVFQALWVPGQVQARSANAVPRCANLPASEYGYKGFEASPSRSCCARALDNLNKKFRAKWTSFKLKDWQRDAGRRALVTGRRANARQRSIFPSAPAPRGPVSRGNGNRNAAASV
jgi:hypothetical protein